MLLVRARITITCKKLWQGAPRALGPPGPPPAPGPAARPPRRLQGPPCAPPPERGASLKIKLANAQLMRRLKTCGGNLYNFYINDVIISAFYYLYVLLINPIS